jgi:hypothetical protein
VPPPPFGDTLAVWQPGHWRWQGTPGNEWVWAQGTYVDRPAGQTAWVQGQWLQVGNSWQWSEAHWQ